MDDSQEGETEQARVWHIFREKRLGYSRKLEDFPEHVCSYFSSHHMSNATCGDKYIEHGIWNSCIVYKLKIPRLATK